MRGAQPTLARDVSRSRQALSTAAGPAGWVQPRKAPHRRSPCGPRWPSWSAATSRRSLTAPKPWKARPPDYVRDEFRALELRYVPAMTASTEPRRVLITGGAGFLGVNAAAHLIGQGWHATVLNNLAPPGTEGTRNGPFTKHPARVPSIKETGRKPTPSAS